MKVENASFPFQRSAASGTSYMLVGKLVWEQEANQGNCENSQVVPCIKCPFQRELGL